MKESPEFTSNVAKFEDEFYYLSQLLNKYSVPFFSQRYAAHMCFETSMPAICGLSRIASTASLSPLMT